MQFLSYDRSSPKLSLVVSSLVNGVGLQEGKTMENYKTVSTKSGSGSLRQEPIMGSCLREVLTMGL